jgi:hypothetical protein
MSSSIFNSKGMVAALVLVAMRPEVCGVSAGGAPHEGWLATATAQLAAHAEFRDEPGMTGGYLMQGQMVLALQTQSTFDLLLDDASPRAASLAWGWGVHKAVDAFGDGSITAAGTPYAITSAVAIHSILDYIEVRSLESSGVAGVVVRNVIEAWLKSGFREKADNAGGFFAYSMASQDAKFTVNCSMLLASAIARSLNFLNVARPPDQQRWKHAVQASVKLALTQRAPRPDDSPDWYYHDIDVPPVVWNYRQDLVHHVYTLEAFEILRDLGYEVPWSRAAGFLSLDRYWRNGRLMSYPSDSGIPPENAELLLQPARLWAAGLTLKFAARYGSRDIWNRYRDALADYAPPHHGAWPKGHVRQEPAGALDLAHAVAGLAETVRRSNKLSLGDDRE